MSVNNSFGVIVLSVLSMFAGVGLMYISQMLGILGYIGGMQ